VTLSQLQLQRLVSGDSVRAFTSTETTPSSHQHTVVLRDIIGLWGAPLTLACETSQWAQPSDPQLNPFGGRPNVEIYNMPAFLAIQTPQLQPDPRIWTALYNFTSPSPANPGTGFVYPQTGDGQAAVILRKAAAADLFYSRALCGFEVFRLRSASQVDLTRNILIRQFRLGLPDGH
jgi:hypothetical protein